MVKSKQVAKKRTMVRKKEKELTRLGTALRALGTVGGGALGGLIGQSSVGSSIGRNLGATVSRWLGSGDYSVKYNSLLSPDGTIPAMHDNSQSVVIRHKEYLGEIKSSQTFTTQMAYSLNPGLSYTFPWLADVASRFQEYRIRGMIFHYIPTSGSAVASTNPALGSVMMQTSYRASDTDPASKVEVLNEYWASESKPDTAFCHPIECSPEQNPFKVQYVRTGAIPAGDNVLFYDLGKTFICTSGMQTTGNPVGDLWVTYEIELRKPVLTSEVNSNVESAVYSSLNPTTVTYFNPLESPILTGNLPCSFSGRTITFPKGIVGTYQITMIMVAATVLTDVNFTQNGTTYTNCSSIPWDNRDSVSNYGTTTSGTSDQLNIGVRTDILLIRDPQKAAEIFYTNNFSWAGTANQVVVRISQIA